MAFRRPPACGQDMSKMDNPIDPKIEISFWMLYRREPMVNRVQESGLKTTFLEVFLGNLLKSGNNFFSFPHL